MISDKCEYFSVDGGKPPKKLDGTYHNMCYEHDAVYRPFYQGINSNLRKIITIIP